MAKYSTPFYLVVALVAVVILGTSIDILDAIFGTQLAAYSGIWLSLAAIALFIAYLVYAYKIWKSKKP